MCRAKRSGGRRCPKCGDPASRSARDRARYALTVDPPSIPGAAETGAAYSDLRVRGQRIRVTRYNADLLETITQDDINDNTEAWREFGNLERDRMRTAERDTWEDDFEIPTLSQDPTREEMVALAEFLSEAYSGQWRSDGLGGSVWGPGMDALRERHGDTVKAVVVLGAAVEAEAERRAGVTAVEIEARNAEERERLRSLTDRDAVRAAQAETAKRNVEDLGRLSEAYREVLAELRPMGGLLAIEDGGHAESVEAVEEAAQVFPSDWLEHANSMERPLHVTDPARRAGYVHDRHETVEVPRTQAWAYFGETDLESLSRSRATSMKDPRKPNSRKHVTFWQQVEKVERSEHDDRVMVTTSLYDYREPGTRKPRGDGWEPNPNGDGSWIKPVMIDKPTGKKIAAIILSRTEETERLPGQGSLHRAAVHELAHRMEYSVPGLNQMATSFRDYRARGEDLKGINGSRTEVGYEDHFVHHYVGRSYENTGGDLMSALGGGSEDPATPKGFREATEVVSCGIEGLFGGGFGGFMAASSRTRTADHEMRHFMLGALASAGR